MSAVLNYDPADPDKMRLPPGKTCGDCVHIHRCKSMFGHVETDTYCDWSPSRFRPLPLEERIQRLPQRGWRIEIGCPFSHLAGGEPVPITFKAVHMRDYSTGDVEESECLDLDGAVSWLEQRLGDPRPSSQGRR